MTRKMLDLEKEFDKMRSQMNNLMSGLFGNNDVNDDSLLSYNSEDGSALVPKSNGVRTPIVTIDEKDDEVVASIEIPGVNKEDIQLDVRNGMLNVRAKHSDEKEENETDKYVYKKSYSEFARSVPIPDYIKEDDVKAKYNNGVLKVHMPKKEEAKREIKHIDIE